jgi:hypothetical protein
MDHGIQTTAAWPARLDYGHLGIRLIPTQAKASTPGLPTGRDDSPAGGVPRKLAGRSPGVAIRHPSGTLLCLHVSKPGSDGLELTPLLPLDATRSSPCRRLGYIVTKGPAMNDRIQPVDHQEPRREATGPGRAFNSSRHRVAGPPARPHGGSISARQPRTASCKSPEPAHKLSPGAITPGRVPGPDAINLKC